MFYLWIDDERAMPTLARNNAAFDAMARTTNEALRIIKREYKSGTRHFFLDIDNDTEDALTNIHGGEFYNVLAFLEQLIHMGRMSNVHFEVRIHTGNTAARARMRSLIQGNASYFQEVI